MSVQISDADRRRFPREEAAMPVVINTATRTNRLGVSRDVSRSGVCVMSNSPLSVGERLQLQLTTRHNAAIPVTGAIVRVQQLPPDRFWRYAFGVNFDALLDELPAARA